MKINITQKRNINGIENGAKMKRMKLMPIFSAERKNCIKNFNYLLPFPTGLSFSFRLIRFFPNNPTFNPANSYEA